MFQQLPLSFKRKPRWLVRCRETRRAGSASTPEPITGPGRKAEPITIPAGETTVGANFDEIAFGWDNEFPGTASMSIALPSIHCP